MSVAEVLDSGEPGSVTAQLQWRRRLPEAGSEWDRCVEVKVVETLLRMQRQTPALCCYLVVLLENGIKEIYSAIFICTDFVNLFDVESFISSLAKDVTIVRKGRRVLQLTKFDYRLSSNLDDELQNLRCRVNYHALKFTKSINELGQKLVMRMRQMTTRFVAVHLRFEPDMLALYVQPN